MKKLGVFILLAVLTISILSIANIKAVTLQDAEKGLNQVNDIKNTLLDRDSRNQLIQEQWNNFLQNNSFGKAIAATGKFMEKLNPLFVIIPGTSFSLSWIFFLSLALVFAIALWSFRLLSLFLNKLWIKLLLTFAIVIAFSISSLINFTSNKIIYLIQSLPNLFSQFVAGFLVFIAIIVLGAFSKAIQKGVSARRKEKKLKKIEEKLKEEEMEENEEEEKSEKEEIEEEDEKRGKELVKEIGRMAREGTDLDEVNIERPKKIKSPKF